MFFLFWSNSLKRPTEIHSCDARECVCVYLCICDSLCLCLYTYACGELVEVLRFDAFVISLFALNETAMLFTMFKFRRLKHRLNLEMTVRPLSRRWTTKQQRLAHNQHNSWTLEATQNPNEYFPYSVCWEYSNSFDRRRHCWFNASIMFSLFVVSVRFTLGVTLKTKIFGHTKLARFTFIYANFRLGFSRCAQNVLLDSETMIVILCYEYIIRCYVKLNHVLN